MDGLIVEVRNSTDNRTMYSHFHSFYEIYYLRRGTMRYVIADDIFEVNEGEIVLIPEGVIHNTVYEGTHIERYLINFRKDFVTELELLSCFDKTHLSLSAKESLAFEELFGKLSRESERRDEYSKMLVGRYIEEILIGLIRNGKQRDPRPSDVYAEIMHSAMKYINEFYASQLTLDSLSDKYSLSRSFFSRKFREVTGFGLAEYITVVRIRNAARILAEERRGVTEAAFAVGYNDSSYFTSTFKRIMGITPLKYAKNRLSEKK